MGLKQRTATGKYVKLKDGKLYLSTDKEFTSPFDELEGTLVDIYFKDESYEGTPQRKLYVVMNDGDENLILGFRFESRYASSFLTFVKNIDVTKKFTLVPISKDIKKPNGETETQNTLLLSQYGKFAKAYYTKDNPHGLPPMRKVKVSGKELWDKTDMLEFLEGVVLNEIKPNLPTPETTNIRDEEPEESLPWNKVKETHKGKVEVEDEVEDDLPF